MFLWATVSTFRRQFKHFYILLYTSTPSALEVILQQRLTCIIYLLTYFGRNGVKKATSAFYPSGIGIYRVPACGLGLGRGAFTCVG